MKTIKAISGTLIVGALLMVGSFQTNAFGKTKPTGKVERVNIMVSGMECPYCSSALKTKLSSLKGAENVTADYKTGCASFDCPASSKVTTAQVKKAVQDAGFTVKDVKFVEQPAQQASKSKPSTW